MVIIEERSYYSINTETKAFSRDTNVNIKEWSDLDS